MTTLLLLLLLMLVVMLLRQQRRNATRINAISRYLIARAEREWRSADLWLERIKYLEDRYDERENHRV